MGCGEDLGSILVGDFGGSDLVKSKIMQGNLGVQKTLE
jgi:hypothetical protein